MFIRLTGLIGAGIAAAAVIAAMPATAQNYTPEQQQLCSNDAFRLCGPDIPDVDRVTACMIRQRAQLSPGCQSVFRYEPAAAPVPVRSSRPMSLKPKTAKATKSRKAKRSAD